MKPGDIKPADTPPVPTLQDQQREQAETLLSNEAYRVTSMMLIRGMHKKEYNNVLSATYQ